MAIVNFLMGVLSWIVKNVALIIGIIEAISKVLGGIVSLTPTKSDDKVVAVIDNVFSWIKKGLYFLSDKLAGKEITVKN